MSLDDLDNAPYGFELAGSALFFDPAAPVDITGANLPHWRQEGVIYFVTFRLADSLPQTKLDQWRREREEWLRCHPDPRGDDALAEYHELFTVRIHHWLDQGYGSCILEIPGCRSIVEDVLRHFDHERYRLGRFVVASNHVHALLLPFSGFDLEKILQAWKGYSAKQIVTVDKVSRRLAPLWEDSDRRRAIHTSRTGNANPKNQTNGLAERIVRSHRAVRRVSGKIRDLHLQPSTPNVEATSRRFRFVRRPWASTATPMGQSSRGAWKATGRRFYFDYATTSVKVPVLSPKDSASAPMASSMVR